MYIVYSGKSLQDADIHWIGDHEPFTLYHGRDTGRKVVQLLQVWVENGKIHSWVKT